jgi:hypothetical protein
MCWLQTAARNVLARRWVQEMHNLQLLLPCTASQLLQVVLHRIEDLDLGHVVSPMGNKLRVYING